MSEPQRHDPDDAKILVTDVTPLLDDNFRASEAEAIVTDNSREAEVAL